jgi:hypothetical protein
MVSLTLVGTTLDARVGALISPMTSGTALGFGCASRPSLSSVDLLSQFLHGCGAKMCTGGSRTPKLIVVAGKSHLPSFGPRDGAIFVPFGIDFCIDL